MRKSTENTRSYIERTNGHSTKPFKTGDNSHLATQHFDIDYTALRKTLKELSEQEFDDRRTQLKAKATAIEELLRGFSKQLRITMPLDEYNQIKKQRDFLAKEKTYLQTELREMKLIRSGNPRYPADSFNNLFHAVVKETLPPDMYSKLIEATYEAISKREAAK